MFAVCCAAVGVVGLFGLGLRLVWYWWVWRNLLLCCCVAGLCLSGFWGCFRCLVVCVVLFLVWVGCGFADTFGVGLVLSLCSLAIL